MSRREGHKLLYEGHYKLAMPAALHSLRFAIALHGPNDIEVVPSYLLLGEASIGMVGKSERVCLAMFLMCLV